jgi:hypothetical protein
MGGAICLDAALSILVRAGLLRPREEGDTRVPETVEVIREGLDPRGIVDAGDDRVLARRAVDHRRGLHAHQ